MKSEAVFDILFIGRKLQLKMTDFSLSEINFFSYLSCLLSLYDGKTVEQWKYNFIKSNLGSPFSSDLNLALDALKANESFVKSDGIEGYYQLSEKGIKALEFYSTLQTFSWRSDYLEAACTSISLLPFGTIKQGIFNEPVLKSANISINKRSLLESNNPATQSLHKQFALLKIALEDKYQDLMIPAVVWIESLNNKTIS
jgi:hypothetical protein